MEASPISSLYVDIREQRVTWKKLQLPVILVGDLNADPSVIPSHAKGMSD